MVRIITGTTKRKVKRRPKDAQLARTKQGKELIISIVVGSYLTHNSSNVACRQIVRSNSTKRSRISISRQCNLYLYSIEFPMHFLTCSQFIPFTFGCFYNLLDTWHALKCKVNSTSKDLMALLAWWLINLPRICSLNSRKKTHHWSRKGQRNIKFAGP
jgi:hypothetical protein